VVRRTWYFFIYIIRFTIQPNVVKTSLGDLSDGGTPGNIPNPEVKPVSADGTWRVASWESRSLPRGFSLQALCRVVQSYTQIYGRAVFALN
jgi:hypothetical protein